MVVEIFPRLPITDEGAPIDPIELTDSVGTVIFQPLHDITGLEAVLIGQLFTRMVLRTASVGVLNAGPMAWRAYLQRTMLMRHFEPMLKSRG